MKSGGIRIETIRIGTRGSELALVQARFIAEKIKKKYRDISVKIVPIKTRGDRMQNISLMKIGGKGVFVKEIEEALLQKEIRIAVHSMKDGPVELPDGLEIAAVPEREDPRDVLISRNNIKMEELPKGAKIGTGSLRRRMQLLNFLPDIEVVPIRGNLGTRIKKIETEGLEGIIAAAAGMKRMGWAAKVSQYIPFETMLPSAGQGVLGIEVRQNDDEIREMISFLNHGETFTEVSAERAFLRNLGGGCQVPIACIGRKQGDMLILRGLVGSTDGKIIIADEVRGESKNWEEIGNSLAGNILSRGGKAVLGSVYGEFC
ncbi:MAG: hydroxymethylbilane synthase [Thermodesulfobacteriota bacterium]|nr:hydroxymethylbilane synthase [Thermodesulfobacteriota bacterium]